MRRTIDLAILAVVLYIFAGYVFPVTLVGKPPPLFEVRNEDSKPHHVRIVVLDGSEEVLNVSYRLKPHDAVSYGRGFGWYLMPTFTPITWASGRYGFVVSTENDTLTREFDVHPWKTIQFVIGRSGRVGWRVIVV